MLPTFFRIQLSQHHSITNSICEYHLSFLAGDNYPILNAPVTASSLFFNNPQVRKKLHVDEVDVEWLGCIPGAGRRKLQSSLLPGQQLLKHDTPESVAPYIAQLLDDAGIRVLIYAGDRDLSVNLQGSEQVLLDMDWSGHDDWKHANRYLWMVDGDVAGYAKTHKNLDMLLVLNSGHLVPYNVPIPALDLIQRLVDDRSYGDVLIPQIDFGDDDDDDDIVDPLLVALDIQYDRSVRHYTVMIIVAVACFLMGTLAGSYQKSSSSSRRYQSIPDVPCAVQ